MGVTGCTVLLSFLFIYKPFNGMNDSFTIRYSINSLKSNIMADNAFQQAVEDILKYCNESGRCFMAFRSNKNSIMAKLVNDYIKEQEG